MTFSYFVVRSCLNQFNKWDLNYQFYNFKESLLSSNFLSPKNFGSLKVVIGSFTINSFKETMSFSNSTTIPSELG